MSQPSTVTCASCGSEEPEGSQFCGNCGAAFAPADQPMPGETMAVCASCGSEEPEGSQFCGSCGASLLPADPQPAPAAVEQLSPVEAAPTPAPGRARWPRWVAAGALALLVVGGATAAVLTQTGGGDSTEAGTIAAVSIEPPPPAATSESVPSAQSPTLVDTVTPRFVELVGYQGALSARVRALEAGVQSFGALRQDADALAASVTATEDALDGFAPTTSEEANTLVVLRRALAAHAAYTDALAGFPALPRSFTREQAQAAIARAGQVQIAYHQLTIAEPALAGVSINSADHLRLLELVPAPAPTPPAETTELTAFVAQVESVLTESAVGRKELGSAIGAGFNCTISTSEAGERVDRVVDNRRRLLARLGSLQTPTQGASEAAGLLREALQHSIDADVGYRDGFFAAGTTGCPLPPNASFTLAYKSDALASAAKLRFVAVFNPLAKSVGRRAWSASEI